MLLIFKFLDLLSSLLNVTFDTHILLLKPVLSVSYSFLLALVQSLPEFLAEFLVVLNCL